ncbi:rod shape-determining protein MreC [Bacillus marinisedimentorum]|uniref:rod shape-determining protein MreC n=1 Tax=Bacillus marinisedimentorum TaxID=1821260 RepID=UPI000872AF99|nr:rod shape-determining protein MreC [Bacillus marinisedimentorum]
MPQFFFNKRLIVLLVSIIFLVALIGFSLNNRQQLSWPEQLVKDTTGWFQSVFHQPAQFVAGFFENVDEMKNLYSENARLKARLDEYVELSIEANELRDENGRLRNILDKKDDLSDMNPIQATVIARSPDRWNEMITVNKGAQHGVKQDMAVITPDGMLGRVKFTAQFTSSVKLLSGMDRTNRISAVVSGKEKVFGLIEGYDPDKQALLFKRIPFDVEVKKGEMVVTSGLGGVFPEGLVIGEIIEVQSDEYGLTQTALIKPAADFYDIDHVVIVERQAVSPEPELDQQKEDDEG